MVQPQVTVTQMASGAALFLSAALVSIFFQPSDILNMTEQPEPTVIVHFPDGSKDVPSQPTPTHEYVPETIPEQPRDIPQIPLPKEDKEGINWEEESKRAEQEGFMGKTMFFYRYFSAYIARKLGGSVFALIVLINLVTIFAMAIHALYRNLHPSPSQLEVAKEAHMNKLKQLRMDARQIERERQVNPEVTNRITSRNLKGKILSGGVNTLVKESQPPIPVVKPSTPEEKAASKIQAVYRGYSVRKKKREAQSIAVVMRALQRFYARRHRQPLPLPMNGKLPTSEPFRAPPTGSH